MSINKPVIMLSIFDHYNDRGEHNPKEILLEKNSIILGRGLSSDVVISSETISAKHARIYYQEEENAWFIEDLSSQNGIVYNAHKIERHMIKDMDEFYLGESLVIIKLHPLNLEKTRNFSIIALKQKKFGFKDVLLMILSLLLFSFFYLKTTYYVVEKDLVTRSISGVMIFLGIWGVSVFISLISQKKLNFAKLFIFNFWFLVFYGYITLIEEIFVSGRFLWLMEVLSFLWIFLYLGILGTILSGQSSSKRIWLRSLIFTLILITITFTLTHDQKTYMNSPYLVSFSNSSKKEKSLQELEQQIDKAFDEISKEYKELNEP